VVSETVAPFEEASLARPAHAGLPPLSIVLAGDLVLDEPDGAYWLADLAPCLRAADLAVGHIEVPHTTCLAELAGDVPAPGAPPENLAAIADVGFGMVSLAGNHIADCGAQGIADTLAGLAGVGVAATGAGSCQLSLPVSTISQWWVVRSSSAVVILGSPNTVGHSPNARLVVMITEVFS